MADDLKRVGLVFKADGTAEFTQSMKEVNASVKENYSEFRKAKSQWNDNTKSADKLRTRQKYLADQTGSYTNKAKILRAELAELEGAENRDEVAISKKRTELNRAEASLNYYKQGLKDVNKELAGGQATLNEYGDKLKNFGKKTEDVGKKMTTKVTLPILGVGTAAVKIAADFDESMSQVRAVSGASGKDFDALREKAIDLGADTAFSAKEVADAMTEMAKAGWSTQDILDGMSGVLDATAASGEDLASVSTIVADSITGFGLSAKDSSHVADLLTKAANDGTIGIGDLGESFKYIAPLSRTMGVSIEDATTAIAAMSNSNIKGSQAGTALRGMLSRMIKPTDAVKDAMKELGISLTDGNGKFKSLDDILKDMRGKFDGLSDEQKAYYATVLSGQEGQAGMLSLLNMTQDQYDKLSDSMKHADGIAQETSDTMRDNLSSDLKELGRAFESAAIKLTESLMPQLRDLVKWLSNIVDKFADLNPKTQDMIVKVGLLAAAIGPLLIAIGKLSSGLGTTMKLGASLAGFAISHPILTAILAVIAGIVLLYTKCKWFRDLVNGIVKGIIGWVKEAYQSTKETFDSVKDQVTGLANKISTTLSNIKENSKSKWNSIKSNMSDVWESMKNKAGSASDSIANKFSNLPAKIKSGLRGLGNIGRNAIQSFIKGFKSMHIPRPHFKMSGKFGLNPPSVPSIGVDWRSKGAILNHPTVLPMASNGKLQGMGESGPEAILPISNLRQYIAEENAKSNVQLVEAIKEAFNGVTIQNDNRTYVGNKEISKEVSKEVKNLIEKKQSGKLGLKGRFA